MYKTSKHQNYFLLTLTHRVLYYFLSTLTHRVFHGAPDPRNREPLDWSKNKTGVNEMQIQI